MNESPAGRALVLGRGTSGEAARRLLIKQGYDVTVADQRDAASATALDDVSGFAFAVVSPGFAIDHPWLQQLRAAGLSMVPEFEYGLSAMPGARVIAVTGSNGKSSFVKWIADTLAASGIRATPAGNYGLPPCALALEAQPPDVIVLELSSFQLEAAVNFRSAISVLLNFAPNHLDRHRDMATYAKAKARLFAHARLDDLILVHAPAWPVMQPLVPASLRPVLFGEDAANEYAHRDGWLLRRGEAVVDLRGTWWGRAPLLTNAAAALAVLDALEIGADAIRAAAQSFSPLPHRLELVATHRGVQYINDSKSSTLTALAAAVQSSPAKKHLIAGGILKESDAGFVKEILAKNCAFVYCIGSAADQLVKAWHNAVPAENCRTLRAALESASSRARAGDVILLSPGCSSFDQFSSYADRGDQFKALVNTMIQSSMVE